MTWDLWVDFQRGRADGTVPTKRRHARPGVELEPGRFVIVGNEEADPAVGEILSVSGDDVVIRVLPGPASEHMELVRDSAPRAAG